MGFASKMLRVRDNKSEKEIKIVINSSAKGASDGDSDDEKKQDDRRDRPQPLVRANTAGMTLGARLGG